MLSVPRWSEVIRPTSVVVLALVLTFVAVLMFPSNPSARLPGQDNGVFLYGGQQILRGKLPYLDFWDHKGPLIHYLNAAGLALAAGSRWGVWILELVLVCVTGLALFHVSARRWGDVAGLIAVAGWAYGLYQVGPYQHFRDSNYTETYAIFFNVLSIGFWLLGYENPKYRYAVFAAGVFTGASFSLRPNNVSLQAAAVLVDLVIGVHSHRVAGALRRLSWMLFGAALVMGGFALSLSFSGGFSAMVDQVFRYNLAYSAKNLSVATALAVFETGNRALSWLPMLAFGLLLSLAVTRRGRASTTTGSRGDVLVYVLLAGWPLEIAMTVLSGRALLHYYILWLPFLALLLAAIPSFAVQPATLARVGSRMFWVVAGVAIVLVARNHGVIASYLDLARLAHSKSSGLEERGALVEYISQNVYPGQTVLVWGNDVWVNFLAERPAPGPYAYQYALFVSGYTTPDKVRSFLSDLETHTPALIIEPVVDTDEIQPLEPARRRTVAGRLPTPAGMAEVYDFVCERYVAETVIGDAIVYRPRAVGDPGPDCP